MATKVKAKPKTKKLLEPPKEGTRITFKGGKLQVPDDPIVCYVRGDGIGLDITPVMMDVVGGAVQKAYGGKRKIAWYRIYAGDDAMEKYGELMPQETLDAVRKYYFAIKGPLTTPIGGGFRSLNVAFRQILDLYACVRPVRWFEGVPSPVKHPEWVNMCIFRENTEDVYAGIEWALNTKEVKKVINFLNKEMKCSIRKDSGIGIKPISVFCSRRIVKKAIEFAIQNKCKYFCLVHKGNIQKYTEGAFKDWGYEFLKKNYRKHIVTEDELASKPYNGNLPEGKVLVNDRIADNIFQQVLTRQREYQVLACTNLNGDYLSDAIAAQVGGLGIAPGANIGDKIHFFEPTHGTAPRYAGKDMVNPSSLILSAVMMLGYMGWTEAAALVAKGMEETFRQKTVTYDFERQMEGARKVSSSEFGRAIIRNM
ncbi:MAG: isocitrate dehydrogenase (NADP(+)) [Candidatus Tectomicrobia bacterium RIFCSPLOWO2_12_FULL_69_37]|nr:MAG: isocitrate dehydrogenase (NADP(+)) [Candidatus Tectomicrobia bacterium RIFCSPLOWO2_02_FULL_70_19]OGL65604.1 MAG: isocitrate dehydrogenase (NADP(+)) [Candidatus Tectomicrobia bacterium RIFCSPLOWO2_12_FULL_69_37]